jgi:hypothetical protein
MEQPKIFTRTSPPNIPLEIQGEILPNKNLSVIDFLKSPLPAVARSPITNPDEYLSPLSPTITSIKEIKSIPTPPPTVLDKLIRSPNITSSQSVLCPHTVGLTSERLPIWILDYWNQVAHIRPVKVKWGAAEDNLQIQMCNKTSQDTKPLIIQVYNALACLAWSVNIKGFWASITSDYLTPYFTKEWFSDEQENQMLYLLQQQVWREKSRDGIDITDTFFIKRLIEVFQEKEEYATKPAYAWIRKKGRELSTGVYETLATIANIDENHWVAVVLDFTGSRIQYGDSMGFSIDEDLEAVLTWWTHQHTGRSFTTSYLPITRQRDGHSCRILAWNALAVHIFPTTYSLMDIKAIAAERLQMFLR